MTGVDFDEQIRYRLSLLERPLIWTCILLNIFSSYILLHIWFNNEIEVHKITIKPINQEDYTVNDGAWQCPVNGASYWQ